MICSDIGEGCDWIVGQNIGCLCWTFERWSAGSEKGAKGDAGNGEEEEKIYKLEMRAAEKIQ